METERSLAEYQFEQTPADMFIDDTFHSYSCRLRDGYCLVAFAMGAIKHDNSSYSGAISRDAAKNISDFEKGRFIFVIRKVESKEKLYTKDVLLARKQLGIEYTENWSATKEDILRVLDLCGGQKQNNQYGGICAKCGAKDEYAAFASKYNEVRCYLHCD